MRLRETDDLRRTHRQEPLSCDITKSPIGTRTNRKSVFTLQASHSYHYYRCEDVLSESNEWSHTSQVECLVYSNDGLVHLMVIERQRRIRPRRDKGLNPFSAFSPSVQLFWCNVPAWAAPGISATSWSSDSVTGEVVSNHQFLLAAG